MIGETVLNPSFQANPGENIAGPVPVPPGRSWLGMRCDGRPSNPDALIWLVCEFSADGGVTWRPLGTTTITGRGVAGDLVGLPGSAHTLLGQHNGEAGLGRLLLTVEGPDPVLLELAIDFYEAP